MTHSNQHHNNYDHHVHHNHHGHMHTHTSNKKLLMIAFFIITGFMIVEIIGGFLTNSLALLSDAGHMLSDSVALFLSLLAFWFSEKPTNAMNSYGYKRAEIIVALINGIALGVISIYIFYEGIQRLFQPAKVQSMGMLWIAVLGLLVNVVTAWILMKGEKDNLNLRSAFLHVLGDLMGSVGAIVAALLLWGFGWQIADPIASILVAILVLVSGWRVTKSSIHILMEGVPTNIQLDKIRSTILEVPEVESIHDLHVWSITSGFPSLSCHIVLNNNITEFSFENILLKLKHNLKKDFGIEHSTIQIETIELCESGESCD
ncbi:cation diffusion facilitator family transporter [Tepidibacillus infernus]|uniref:Zinc transporter ZitB n=1 Tax=Tepidibacillus decaturensis TaxID=1413211 RepID=A0A135L2Z5_9BACI|nr:cation diffusion facilitator family transporter [Tepidibacillus decaturensis]KXG43223.1 hypothetical protein U473_03740 [Tepidibacillus decaturensis]